MSAHLPRGRRPRHHWTVLAAPTALLLAGGLVWNGASAAFKSGSSSPSATWGTGTVLLTGSPSTTLFTNVPNLQPGSFDEKCIRITYGGNVPGRVILYAPQNAVAKADGYLRLSIDEGTGSSTNCSDFGFGRNIYNANEASNALTWSTFRASHQRTSGAIPLWNPPANSGEARTYRVRWFLLPDDEAANTTASPHTVNLALTWEAQNT
ncbi:hypothetical protein NUM3379_41820 [Kineococcus sp. NUM-3379]